MPAKTKLQNINTVWAELIVEELRRCGVEHFCVAPGSRSAPLALAVAKNPDITSIVHYDERGLGFHALGLTSATLKPTVVITTSGTAVANLFPSVIEASKKKLPLIIISADRPPELRATGANQTIDQVKIFGEYARFFFDMPCPGTHISPEMVLTTIDQVVSRAKGEIPGPVHLNCMFREPLSPHQDTQDFSVYLKPLANWQNSNSPLTRYPKSHTVLSADAVTEAMTALSSIKNGIIAVGKISGPQEEEAVLKLSQKLNWPIFADVTSGLRLGHSHKHIIHHFDHILAAKGAEKFPVDGILHLGGRLTSNRWLQFVQTIQPRHYIMVLKHPLRHDPHHMVTLRLQCSVADFCEAAMPVLPQWKVSAFLKQIQKADQICSQECTAQLSKITALTEPVIAHSLTQMLPEHSGIFIGNSMPIRELNLFASSQGRPVRVTANRGASGIDGNIATAAGFAKGADNTCTAIIGDLACLHDLNSLAFLQKTKKPFVLIVVNNNGGAIFSFLPVAQTKTDFEKFFTTPHGLTFEAAAKLFGLSYHRVTTPAEFKTTYNLAIQKQEATILELTAVTVETLKTHQALQTAIQKRLTEAGI